jgi:hypothetical protein
MTIEKYINIPVGLSWVTLSPYRALSDRNFYLQMKTDLKNEIWKDIPGYEGLYQVSNMGRVYSFPKEWISGKGAKRSHAGKMLNLNSNTRGYHIVTLSNDNGRATCLVSRLVWETFNHKTDLQIDHIIEGNRTDNKLSNLQPVNNRENCTKYRLTTKKTSQYTGVFWDTDAEKWNAQIQYNGKPIHLGCFDTELDASTYYNNALSAINNNMEIIRDVRIPSSKYKGITFSNIQKKWKSLIVINNKRIHIGTYNTEEEAYTSIILRKCEILGDTAMKLTDEEIFKYNM